MTQRNNPKALRWFYAFRIQFLQTLYGIGTQFLLINIGVWNALNAR